MKYFLIALLAIGIGFGAAKLTLPNTLTNIRGKVSGLTAKLDQAAPVSPAKEVPTPPSTTEPEAVRPTTLQGGINNSQVTVTFIGSKGATTYPGYFEKITSDLKLLAGVVIGAIAVDTNSLKTPVPEATTNWKSATQFDTAKFPVMTFSFATWKKVADNNFLATGNLTVKGVTKTVTMPMVLENNQYSGEINVKATDIGLSTKLITDLKIFVKVPLQL